MPSASYSFLDVVVLEEVRERFAAGDALVILSDDLEDVIWANGPGAVLFGQASIEEIIGAPSGLGPVTKRQIKATSGFPAIGRNRSVLARMATGNALMFQASAVVLPDGEQAILLASPAGSDNQGKATEAALIGFGKAGQYVAFLDGRGTVEAASPGFSLLGLTADVLTDLIGRLGGETRMAKRMLSGARGPLPAGLARLTEDPPRHLLVVIDENPTDDSPAMDVDVLAIDGMPAAVEEMPIADEVADASAEDATTPAETHAVPAPTGDDTDFQSAAAVNDDVADPLAWDDAGLPIDAPQGSSTRELSSGSSSAVSDHDSWYFNAQGSEPAAFEEEELAPVFVVEDQSQHSFEEGPEDEHPLEDGHADGGSDASEALSSDAPEIQEPELPLIRAGADAVADKPVAETDSIAADVDTGASVADEPAETAEPTVSTADTGPEESPSPPPVERLTSPVRFVWRTDADGNFSQVSPEFSQAVGEPAADIVGRRFEDVVLAFGLDPSGEIAGLLARRDTWSGRSVLWPVAGTELKIPVDLAALPVYSRTRDFEGFRGFGVARGGDAVVDPERLGLALMPGGVSEPPVDEAETAQAPKAEFPTAADDLSADPFQGEVPALAIAPMPDRRFADKVIRLAEHRPAANDKGLTTGERIAFQQIGERLKKDTVAPTVDELKDAGLEGREAKAFAGVNDVPDENPEGPVGAVRAETPDAFIPPVAFEGDADIATEDDVDPVASTGPETVDTHGEHPGEADDTTSIAALPENDGPVSSEMLETPGAEAETEDELTAAPPSPVDVREPAWEESPEPAEPVADICTGEASLVEGESDPPPSMAASVENLEPVAGDESPEVAPPVGPPPPAQKPIRSGLSLIDFSGWKNDGDAPDEVASIEVGANPAIGAVEGEQASLENASDAPAGGEAAAEGKEPDSGDAALDDTADVFAPLAGALHSSERDEAVADGADAADGKEPAGQNDNAAADAWENTASVEVTEPISETPEDAPANEAPAEAPEDAPPDDADGLSAAEALDHGQAEVAIDAGEPQAADEDGLADPSMPDTADMRTEEESAALLASEGLPVETLRVHGDTQILDKLPVPVLVHSGDILHYANAEFLALTGHDSLDELDAAGGIGALFADPYSEDDGDPKRDRQLRLRRKDGEDFPVEAFLRSVPWGDGKALLLVLSRTKEGAAATQSPLVAELEARVAEMRTIIDTATDGVVLIARDGTVRSISRPAEALFGLDSDDVAGKPFVSLFAIESQRAARDYLNGLSDNGVASVLNDGREVIGREAQGRFIPLFMTIGRLPSDSGFCAVVRDITQWKRAEEELTQARAVAERASSHKTDFLARVSHEIRTPLNAIIGFSELMIDEKFGPVTNDRYRDYLRDINRSGNHVLDLVNDLLDISKIEAGQQDMAYEAVSLNDTLSETVAMMQPQANRERVIIRSSFASKLPDVVADLRSVRQIALNILSNAVRYTQAGGQVIVSTAYEASGDVAMRVRDTGIGMTQAEIEQALKPFKQINSLKRARGDGTGLGLPLTKAMVEANRAKFVIHSTPGEGTLVEITFPSTRVLAE